MSVACSHQIVVNLTLFLCQSFLHTACLHRGNCHSVCLAKTVRVIWCSRPSDLGVLTGRLAIANQLHAAFRDTPTALANFQGDLRVGEFRFVHVKSLDTFVAVGSEFRWSRDIRTLWKCLLHIAYLISLDASLCPEKWSWRLHGKSESLTYHCAFFFSLLPPPFTTPPLTLIANRLLRKPTNKLSWEMGDWICFLFGRSKVCQSLPSWMVIFKQGSVM